MNEGSGLSLKFWGVRGSTPTPQIENFRFGGNTPCVEVRSGSDLIVLDAGTGLRLLGQSLTEEFPGQQLNINMFVTHFHWDHIQGMPFFGPAYGEANSINYYSGVTHGNFREILEGLMKPPYFPVRFEALAACRNFEDMEGQPAKIGAATIHPFPLYHPQGASGYRIESPDGVIVYATDFEHGDPYHDRILREYSANADILIYDAQYTPEEYETHRSWGHSTWLEATRAARDARVEKLVLFHHDPSHTDRVCEDIVDRAVRHFENTIGATEGWSVTLSKSASQPIESVSSPVVRRRRRA